MWHVTEPVLLVIFALAFMRVIGLITADTITEPIRDRVLEWLDDAPGSIGQWLSYLITCPWCASVWVGAVAGPLIYFHGDNAWMIVPALALALSQLAGMTNNLGRG
jgi:hypothetical protein